VQTLPNTEQIHQIDKFRGAVGTYVCVPDTYFPSLGRPELIDSVHYFSRPRNLFGGGFPKSKKVLGGVGQKPKKFQVGSPPPPEKKREGGAMFPEQCLRRKRLFFPDRNYHFAAGVYPPPENFWEGSAKIRKNFRVGSGFSEKKVGGGDASWKVC